MRRTMMTSAEHATVHVARHGTLSSQRRTNLSLVVNRHRGTSAGESLGFSGTVAAAPLQREQQRIGDVLSNRGRAACWNGLAQQSQTGESPAPFVIQCGIESPDSVSEVPSGANATAIARFLGPVAPRGDGAARRTVLLP